MSTLLRSQVECPTCGDLVASIHRHDFRCCSCGGTCIDGGRDYLRLLGDAIVGVMPDADRSIRVEEDLTLEEGSHCLAVLRALCAISDKDKPGSARGLRMVNNSLAANIIWPERGRRGLPAEHKPPEASTRKWLNLLVKNGLVERITTRNRHKYQPLVRLADHPDVP